MGGGKKKVMTIIWGGQRKEPISHAKKTDRGESSSGKRVGRRLERRNEPPGLTNIARCV